MSDLLGDLPDVLAGVPGQLDEDALPDPGRFGGSERVVDGREGLVGAGFGSAVRGDGLGDLGGGIEGHAGTVANESVPTPLCQPDLTAKPSMHSLVGMTTYEDPADQLAEECEREHDRRDSDCGNCAIRATIQHCGTCSADFVDGRWYTALGSTAPNGCDHEALTDDWGQDVQCDTLAFSSTVGAWLPCGRTVYRAGAHQCDWHLLAVEYQTLVAVR